MITKILHLFLLHNTYYNYVLVVGYFVAGFIVIKGLRKLLFSQNNSLIPMKIKKSFLFFGNGLYVLLYSFLLYGCLQLLNFPLQIDRSINFIATWWLGIYAIHTISKSSIIFFVQKYSIIDDKDSRGIFGGKFLLVFSRILIWSIGLIILADNLGIKITPVVAGLGIGGIATALAAQVLLKDMLSCVALFLDKPFQVGDLIYIDDIKGTVEQIGLRTTKIRSLSGEKVIFANSKLSEIRIKNFQDMRRRRIVFEFKITYNTPVAKLDTIPTAVKKIIDTVSNSMYEGVYLQGFDDYGFVFEVVYYVLGGNWHMYMTAQDQINFGVVYYLNAQDIKFAQRTW